MTSKQSYERPTITRQQEGFMNKVGRSIPPGSADTIDGVSISQLAERFGSPLFVFSERMLRARLREARQAFTVRYPRVQFCWSYKTNYLDAICRICHQEGWWAEVVSEMEYRKARRLNVPGNRIVFNGPWKSPETLQLAVKESALVQVDNSEEIAALEMCVPDGETFEIGIRINLDAQIYPQWDRFGFNLEGGHAYQALKRIATGGKLRITTLHCHLGTFILDPLAYGRAIAKLLDFARIARAEFLMPVRQLNLGGGFASSNTLHSQYLPGDQVSPSLAQYADAITAPLLAAGVSDGFTLLLETGRALVDECGSIIATVRATKRLASGRRAIVIDAGVHILFTAWWYRLQLLPAQPPSGIAEETTVYGPLCMNIDCVRDAVTLPDLQAGDRLVIRPAGAYCFTQSMQFIHLRPACVLIGPEGQVDCIRRAEVLEDLTGPEQMPQRLAEHTGF